MSGDYRKNTPNLRCCVTTKVYIWQHTTTIRAHYNTSMYSSKIIAIFSARDQLQFM